MNPLILTAWMDDAASAYFNELRQKHFPPERNYLQAHITLFHKLPGGDETATATTIRQACRGIASIPASAHGVRFLGRGVAIEIAAPELAALRSRLAAVFDGELSLQDNQSFRPHVTVQNKVEPDVARALHNKLSNEFTVFLFQITGLVLWRYLDGPWEKLEEIAFAPPD